MLNGPAYGLDRSKFNELKLSPLTKKVCEAYNRQKIQGLCVRF